MDRPKLPFQDEPEELPSKSKTTSKPSSSTTLFGPECEESETSESEDYGCQTKTAGMFTLGWEKFFEGSKARFNGKVSKVSKSIQKKRPYDNTQRAARAAYQRKGNIYKENGKNPQRISTVLATDECLCALDVFRHLTLDCCTEVCCQSITMFVPKFVDVAN